MGRLRETLGTAGWMVVIVAAILVVGAVLGGALLWVVLAVGGRSAG